MPLSSLASSIISGVAGAGLSTLGNLAGSSITYNQQKKLAEQQFNYNKQLMQMQQDYNNPVTQMNYWKAAGVNPYAVVGDTTSISGSSVGQGSASNLSNMGSQAVEAFDQAYTVDAQRQQLLGNARAALSQSKQLDADALKKLSEVKGIDIQNDILKYQANDFKNKINLENKLIMSQIAALDTESTLNELRASMQVAENKNYQTLINQQLAESAARIKLMYNQGELTKAQAAECLAGAMLANAQTIGVKLNNKTANALSLDFIEKFGLDMNEQKERIKHLGKENDWYEWNHSIGSALNGLGLFISPSTFVGRKVVKGFK